TVAFIFEAKRKFFLTAILTVGFALTLRVVAELVTEPTALLALIRYFVPEAAKATRGSFSVALVAPTRVSHCAPAAVWRRSHWRAFAPETFAVIVTSVASSATTADGKAATTGSSLARPVTASDVNVSHRAIAGFVT